jgi:hypothetical protein
MQAFNDKIAVIVDTLILAKQSEAQQAPHVAACMDTLME